MRFIRIFAALTAAVLMLTVSVSAEDTAEAPVYASAVTDGTYGIKVKSSSSMFKIVDCQLTVSGDSMTAVMTLSGKGYGKLYMGTGAEALNADESAYIPFAENSEGQYTYTVPVPALDTPVQCAAWSIRKEQWYDRDLVFGSEELPEGAVTTVSQQQEPNSEQDTNNMSAIIIVIAVCAVAVCAVIIAAAAKKKKKQSE